MATRKRQKDQTRPTTPGLVLAANIRRGRGARALGQSDVAERMVALGFSWVRQTVSEIERGRRAVTVPELVGLAMALSTSVVALLNPATFDRFTSELIDVGTDRAWPAEEYGWKLTGGMFTGGSQQQYWDGNTPSFTVTARMGFWSEEASDE